MLLPNNKRYLLYIKTAKTGGTSFLEHLERCGDVKKYDRCNGERKLSDIKENDIIMIQNDILIKFSKEYPEIYRDSYKIIISRNPYTKCISAYDFLVKRRALKDVNAKEKNVKELLMSERYYEYDCSKYDYKIECDEKDWKLFSLFGHFFLEQSFGLTKEDIDDVIRFENLEKDVDDLFKKLDINIKKRMPHRKKSIVPKMEADEDIKSLIYEKFKKDFELFDYPK
tara:strand:- start:429 stop:1106 length:678 start_codon:yes stop_codon:yes gene_type:complete